MPVVRDHPSVVDLAAFTLGTLGDDAETAAIEAHVAACTACQERAALADGDSLVDLLRAAHASTGLAGDTVTVPPGPEAPTEPEAGRVPAELAGHERYRVVRVLGAGGMGLVYEAEHRVLRRPVAVKVINRAFTANPTAVARFRREVRAAARLSHPNIVTTHDAEDAGETHFLVMEYVEGVSLARLVQERGPLPVAEACDAVRQAALGLQHAHERGMVHRDVKPANLLRCPDGTVKVLDFGLAVLAAEGGDGLTDTNVVMGTPDYLAPEQALDARTADVRSDVYGLGCTLYYLLTGRPPYPAATALLKILAHRERPVPALRDVRPDVPAELARVVERMLAKDPARRYQTPGEVARALEAILQPAGPKRPAGRGWLAALAAVLVVGVAGVTVHRIATDTGELVITTESDDVEVVVKAGGKVVRVLDTKTEKTITLVLRSGTYELELKGAPEGLKLTLDKATLTRGDTVLAKIERVARGVPPAAPSAEKDALALIHRIDWRTDGVLFGDAAARGRYFLAAVNHESGKPRGVRVWDGQTGKFLWDQNNAHWARFSPDGDEVYLAEQNENGTAAVLSAYRTADGVPVRVLCRPDPFAYNFYLAADGQYLATQQRGEVVSLWRVADGKRLREWSAPRSWNFTPDGKHFWVAEGQERLRQYRLPGLEEVRLPDALAAYDILHARPGGRHAIAAERGSTPADYWLVDADGRKLHRWLPRAYGKMLDWVPWVGEQDSLVSLEDGTLRLFDVVTQRERLCYRLPPGEKALRIDVAQDRAFATAATNTGAVLLFRLPDPRR